MSTAGGDRYNLLLRKAIAIAVGTSKFSRETKVCTCTQVSWQQRTATQHMVWQAQKKNTGSYRTVQVPGRLKGVPHPWGLGAGCKLWAHARTQGRTPTVLRVHCTNNRPSCTRNDFSGPFFSAGEPKFDQTGKPKCNQTGSGLQLRRTAVVAVVRLLSQWARALLQLEELAHTASLQHFGQSKMYPDTCGGLLSVMT